MTDPGKVTGPSAIKKSLQRVGRTIIQMIAGGGMTVLIDQIATDLPTSWTAYFVIGWSIVVGAVQNIAEELGWIKPIMKDETKVVVDGEGSKQTGEQAG